MKKNKEYPMNVISCFTTSGIALLLSTLIILSGCVDSNKNKTPGLNFSFTTLDGVEKTLSDYYGTVIILDLMAVRCNPCWQQIFQLEQINKNYSREDVRIISIDVWITYGETPQMLQENLSLARTYFQVNLNWTFCVDDTQGSIEKEYALDGVPSLYILDREGNIYYSHIGYEPYSTLKIKIDELLQK
ncbi:MAG: TlpA disulfide reductase family protein [Methanobacteriota archaeon]